MTNIYELKQTRQLTDTEVRGALRLLMHATQYARRSMGRWMLNKGGMPAHDELLALATTLNEAENAIGKMVKGPPTDGHTLDNMIEDIAAWDIEENGQPIK